MKTAKTHITCVINGLLTTFATKEMIPLIPSPCKESVLNRVRSASDDHRNGLVSGKIAVRLLFVTR